MGRQPLAIGVTIGDPAGVGPEVAVKALLHKDWSQHLRPILIGDLRVIEHVRDGLRLREEVGPSSNIVQVT